MLVRTAGLSRSKDAPFARAVPASDATPSGPWPCPAFDVVAGAATGAPLVIACFTLGLALKQPLTSTAPTNHVTCAARPAPPHRFRRSNIQHLSVWRSTRESHLESEVPWSECRS